MIGHLWRRSALIICIDSQEDMDMYKLVQTICEFPLFFSGDLKAIIFVRV